MVHDARDVVDVPEAVEGLVGEDGEAGKVPDLEDQNREGSVDSSLRDVEPGLTSL